ncbi:hypothetical protein T190_02415 [Sinorhizobium meliloti CCBAU 01290]|nr:hypothetical protein T190_02415 [Sinorhizobium meliloti CCBAU 01290]
MSPSVAERPMSPPAETKREPAVTKSPVSATTSTSPAAATETPSLVTRALETEVDFFLKRLFFCVFAS